MSLFRAADSLFLRLLLLQIGLVLLVALLLGGLFFVERNRSLAHLQARLWAPWIQQALELPLDRPMPPGSPVLARQHERPADALMLQFRAPRTRALRETLQTEGIVVRELALVPGDGMAQVWLEVRAADGQPRWIWLVGDLIEPAWPLRMAVALGAVSVLLVMASWYFTRRLTRPLQRLRERIDVVRPDDLEAPLWADAAQHARAPPEIAAIAAAHQRLLERLARHERERGLLLAGVSHDLRSPLARIRLAAQLLPEEAGVAKRRDAILRNTDLADRLVGSFLDHVRAGELPMNERVDLVALARQVQASFQATGRTVGLVLPPQALTLPAGNALLVERAVSNLLDNAIQYGRLPVQLSLQQRGDEALMDVDDAGDGIAPAQLDLALSAFGRGDASRGVPGTGLGLSIVARVAARLGGRLEMQQAPGLHRMRLVLPLRRGPEPG